MLDSKYMHKLIKFINEEYRSGKKVFPLKKDIFKAYLFTTNLATPTCSPATSLMM